MYAIYFIDSPCLFSVSSVDLQIHLFYFSIFAELSWSKLNLEHFLVSVCWWKSAVLSACYVVLWTDCAVVRRGRICLWMIIGSRLFVMDSFYYWYLCTSIRYFMYVDGWSQCIKTRMMMIFSGYHVLVCVSCHLY